MRAARKRGPTRWQHINMLAAAACPPPPPAAAAAAEVELLLFASSWMRDFKKSLAVKGNVTRAVLCGCFRLPMTKCVLPSLTLALCLIVGLTNPHPTAAALSDLKFPHHGASYCPALNACSASVKMRDTKEWFDCVALYALRAPTLPPPPPPPSPSPRT